MFKNRIDAAEQLLSYLQNYQKKDALVLAIPRGGVPMGHHIAKALDLPLDIVLTKKIGHPLHKELAIGAVSLNSSIIDHQYDVPDSYIEEEIHSIRKDLQRKYELYKGKGEGVDFEHKHLILIDDGIATGITMLATIQLVRKQKPASVTVVVPVSSVSARNLLQPEVDEYISLLMPANFRAVSQFYEEYEQVSDEEVVALLHG